MADRRFSVRCVMGAVSVFSLAGVVALGGEDDVLKPVVMTENTFAPSTTPSSAEVLAEMERGYAQSLRVLADPFMEGRAPGTRGNRIAADYIEFNFRQLGLKPAFTVRAAKPEEEGRPVLGAEGEKVYRQPFIAPGYAARPSDTITVEKQELTYTGADGKTVTEEPGKAFNILGYSASGEVTAPVVFVGYSIDEGEEDYSSYPVDAEGKKIDLTGKAALVLRFEPMDEKGKSKWSTAKWSGAADLTGKLRAAADHGAAAIILVNAPGADDERTNKLADISLGGRQLKIPVVMMSIDAADGLVRAADAQGRSLMDLRKLADEKGEVIDLPNAQVSVGLGIQRRILWSDNVGAVLPGRGKLAEEYVVVGSHYDHVGYGYVGAGGENRGKIHAGADDNASGTCGNLAVARRMVEAMADLPEDVERRSVLFLTFSAEESGLVGSKAYCEEPITEAQKHALMLNMDMIGRLRDGKMELGGTGTAKGLKEWLQPYVDSSGMNIAMKKSGLGPSDHASFAQAGVPALFFFTLLHKQYHTPEDTIDTVNTQGAAQVADLVFRVAFDAALRAEPFAFTNASGTDEEAKKDGEEKKEEVAQDPAPRRGVRFGIMPDSYEEGGNGIKIGEVYPDMPAAKAGLKKGDILTKWDGKEVGDVQSWMPMLGKHKPGDKVKVTYLRDGQEHEVEVELVGRSGSQ